MITARIVKISSIIAAVSLGLSACAQDTTYRTQREAMVQEINRAFFGREKVRDERVLEAMRKVERHKFVPEEVVQHAYRDTPLPIGHGQTISQPYIVAIMTDLLKVDEDDKVLEIGTGSGYQAAVLAELVAEVYTIEIVEPLGEEAAERLEALGYKNVTTKIGDGYIGWEEHAPFDGIIVTAAAPEIPQPLIDQLKPGARMVIPVGEQDEVQQFTIVEKNEDGEITRDAIMPVRFVPLTRNNDEDEE
jgi:protein-L-isoaspartate(D-aspartate) O-methyltransferase